LAHNWSVHSLNRRNNKAQEAKENSTTAAAAGLLRKAPRSDIPKRPHVVSKYASISRFGVFVLLFQNKKNSVSRLKRVTADANF
jgi:hypothetical protein